MKQYAKYKGNGRLVLCPRNGYVDGIAISNLNAYFNYHPEKAEQEGYMVVKFLEDAIDDETEFKIIDNAIYEVIK
jgi:hypothetical protein